MKKVCFVIHSLQPGGTERVMAELIHHFVKKTELELHLVLYGKDREIFYSIPASVHIHQPVFTFDSGNRFYSTIKTLRYLRSQIREIAPDVVLSLGEYWNSFVLLALTGLKYPVYISDRCQPGKHLGNLHEFLRKWLYPGAAGIIAQTEAARQIYQKKSLNSNIRVIGNPIRTLNHKNGSPGKENIILMVGRLIESKHHDRLISIFQDIDKSHWKLVIVGGDALKQDGMKRLQALVKENGMEDQVIFTGIVADVETYYHKSKIFAFTSSSEGFPNAIGEAMSAGLPIVAYDCMAGPSDLIKDSNNGFLIPLFNDEEFKEKMKLLMEDEHLREKMGETSKELIKKYSSDAIGEKYYSFILD